MEEIWKDIPGYENLYQVSNLGRIRRINYSDKNNPHCNWQDQIYYFKMNSHDKDGYILVILTKNKKRKTYKVHRLVLETFEGITKERTIVNHINGRKDDNRICNLEWVNNSENIIHAYKNNLVKNKGGHKKKIYGVNICDNTILKFDSLKEASKKIGVVRTAIGNCLNGRSSNSGGYRWFYDK